MDLIDELKSLGEKIKKLKNSIETEEAVKTALVLPFIRALGYDIFNPTEVVPEFVADVGSKKGEKVDYAIFKDEKPIIIIECKHHIENLDHHKDQIIRYFSTTETRFGVLTDGIIYRFYTDNDDRNKMDEKPFLEFNLLDLKENLINEIKKFHRDNFNLENIINSASELKYLKEIKDIMQVELENPSDDFVKFFINNFYSGMKTAKITEKFRPIVKKSLNQFISDLISDRLKAALAKEEESIEKETEEKEDNEDYIANGEGQELNGERSDCYHIVKSILSKEMDITRLSYNNGKILTVRLDGNMLKPICRLRFLATKNDIGFPYTEEGKLKEKKYEINSPADIYKYSDQIIEALRLYDNKD